MTQRALGPDGTIVGKYDENSMLNSIVYEVEFSDGQVNEYSANVIAENMLTQVDSDGFSMSLMEGIVDYRKDDAMAVSKADIHIITRRGQKKSRKITVGWKLLVRWKDQSESWIHLKDMKESHPVEVAEFAKVRGIADDLAFIWWVPCTLRKRDIILLAVRSHIRKATHKYRIEIPNNNEHAYEIDRKQAPPFGRMRSQRRCTMLVSHSRYWKNSRRPQSEGPKLLDT
jgi:hypothetical protein